MNAEHTTAFATLRSVAAAAGLLTKFDAEGVLVIAIPDAPDEKTDSRPTPPGDAPPGLEGRQGGDGQSQGPQQPAGA